MSTFFFVAAEEAVEAILKEKVKYSGLMTTVGNISSQRIRKQFWGFLSRASSHEEKNYFFANSIIFSLQIFLGALAFSFFAKGFSGSYMKSMSSQIERRFEISSSIVGIIDGSFEIGMCTLFESG